MYKILLLLNLHQIQIIVMMEVIPGIGLILCIAVTRRISLISYNGLKRHGIAPDGALHIYDTCSRTSTMANPKTVA